LRGFIRTAIRDLFCTFIYETRRHNGIAEILEVLGSIINGFAVPLKEEHKQFLFRVLMPLHKPKNLTLYNTQLTYCICQFLDKEPSVVDTVFKLLMRMWPVGNSPKEVMFLTEIDELLNVVDELHFKRVRVPIFKQIASCFASEHFQVAERALYLWSNDHIVSLVADSVDVILPIIYSVLFNNAYHHWNRSIRSLSLGSLQLFQEIDGPLYSKVAKQYKEEQEKKSIQRPALTLSGRIQNKGPVFASKTIISTPPEGKPQEGPPIRRKSLLPVDPSTLAALTVHKSLEDIVASGDDFDNSNSNNSDSDRDSEREGDADMEDVNNDDNDNNNNDTNTNNNSLDNYRMTTTDDKGEQTARSNMLRYKIRSS